MIRSRGLFPIGSPFPGGLDRNIHGQSFLPGAFRRRFFHCVSPHVAVIHDNGGRPVPDLPNTQAGFLLGCCRMWNCLRGNFAGRISLRGQSGQFPGNRCRRDFRESLVSGYQSPGVSCASAVRCFSGERQRRFQRIRGHVDGRPGTWTTAVHPDVCGSCLYCRRIDSWEFNFQTKDYSLSFCSISE